MNEPKAQFDLVRAQTCINSMQKFLLPGCDQLEVAGSVRRRKARVSDIELVIIPKPDAVEFGMPPGKCEGFTKVFEYFRLQTHATVVKNGERFKQLTWAKTKLCPSLDLFIVRPPAQFGVIYLIRTGSKHFNMEMIKRGEGLGIKFKDGAMWKGDRMLICPTEAQVFEALEMNFIPPEERS